MNLKQIREESWDLARDTAIVDEDKLWPTKEMNRYINRVYRHIARETKCIKDAATTSICRITSAPPVDIAALTALAATNIWAAQDLVWYNDSAAWLHNKLVAPYVYTLDQRILDIDEIKWTNKAWKLNKVSVTKWQINPWWEQVVGMPTEFCTDFSNNTLAINFRSEEADTLKLIVRRLPLTDLITDTDTPEFRTHYHDYFINGVLWQMYSKQDADTIDKTRAEEYRQAFLRDVDEIKQQEVILDQRLKPNSSMDAFR